LIILRIAERYEEDLEAIFFVKLLYVTDLFGLADNVRRYVLFACPDLWEGMAWFLPTRRITIFSFWLLNGPAATISLLVINNLP